MNKRLVYEIKAGMRSIMIYQIFEQIGHLHVDKYANNQ